MNGFGLAPIFYPGQIMQSISSLLFYAVILAFIVGGAYIWYQGKRIDGLKVSLTKCELTLEAEAQGKTFLEENMKIIKRNCARKPKPSIVEGKVKLENLFNGPPE